MEWDDYWGMWYDADSGGGGGSYYYEDGSYAGYQDWSGQWYPANGNGGYGNGGGSGGGSYVEPPAFESDDPWLSYQNVDQIPGFDPNISYDPMELPPANLLVLPADWIFGFDPENPDLTTVPAVQSNPSCSIWDKLKKIGATALGVAAKIASGISVSAGSGGGTSGGGGGGSYGGGSYGGGTSGGGTSISQLPGWIPIAVVGGAAYLFMNRKGSGASRKGSGASRSKKRR
jgi:hypothetical protein